VNYFELHVGDYQRKTAHLSLAEHGAYSLMLQIFYATERPLPSDRKNLYRLLRAVSNSERSAIDSVVSQFWRESDGGLLNSRAEEVIEKYRLWVAQQQANGKRGGRRPLTKPLTDGEPIAEPSHSNGGSDGKPNGGVRARVPTSHSDQIPTPTPPKGGAARQRRISPDRAEKDAALEVWNQLVTTAGAEPPRDHRLQAAIDAVGGWSRIAQREQGHDSQRVQRDFVEAYRSAPQ
jgi:uncharacterized protein YdaU (DUF1376 family)